MTTISEAGKQAIVKKALTRNGQTLHEIAESNNIGYSTLHRWIKTFSSEGKIIANHVKKISVNAPITPVERFRHLQATQGQESAKVGAYCREHGLYPHQLSQWEAEFMTTAIKPNKKQDQAELKGLRAEIKGLKQIIARKDKVLAETVALLVLKKKAAQIWGEPEED